MVVKVYASGISGNKEVKKRQQRVLLILDSKSIKYELLDIAEPNMEEAKEYMQNNSKMNGGTISDPNPRHPLPPQIFNDNEYCGDYDAFDLANENDEMEKFLKLPEDQIPTSNVETKLDSGEVPSEAKSKEASPEKDSEIKENGNEDDNAVKEEDESEEKTKEKSPPQKEKSLQPDEETSASPQKEKSPSPQKEKSPSPQKEKSPSLTKAEETGSGDNETDDQKAENGSKEEGEEAETTENPEETEKSEEA